MAYDTLTAVGTALDANPAGHSVALPSQRVGNLVRHAISVLSSDREAAARCLEEASALLGADAQDCSAPTSFGSLTERSFRPGGLPRWQVNRTLAYIESNLGSKMSTREMASLVSYSTSHFSRAFKRSLGLSPTAYVAIRRVERAKALISSTREHLSEIALACGFADQPHFNRSFRRIVGVSPGQWRRNHADLGSTGT